MPKFEIVGTCDICDEEILDQDEFHLVDDVLYCSECFKNAVAAGTITEDDY